MLALAEVVVGDGVGGGVDVVVGAVKQRLLIAFSIDVPSRTGKQDGSGLYVGDAWQ